MVDQAEAEDEFAAGQRVGRKPDGSAIECPFLPGADLDRRWRWLRGFAAVRPSVATTKSEPPPKGHQPGHAG